MNALFSVIIISMLASLSALSACAGGDDQSPGQGRKVETSGKEAAALAEVPEAVLEAAHAARPELRIVEAEHEVRDGREYYDVGGTLPDGSELELDMMLDGGEWTVVEVQRDIGLDLVPPGVQAALSERAPGWLPERIIESDQGGSVVIYEFFGPSESGDVKKIEVKWEYGRADVLNDEWQH